MVLHIITMPRITQTDSETDFSPWFCLSQEAYEI